ncbi:hypothetical protein JG688_00014807 [Phytophthora aleatoria]|uniref:Uncharacterized protein n=1 Tax=Phytophthora aleatoria TaxID=2496075 RepID=A0A8J5IUR3_9STRA|nr:hypothetical protein JG688_00014807 [Phytophthora aleatoria]
MILWKLYDSVADATGKEEEKKPLKTAMHKVMKTLKETNLFFYLQVLYQPPPEHLDERWEITASERLTAITASMAPHFIALSKRSAALRNKRDAFVRTRYGWNQLRVTLSFARRAARHFHFLVLHLYSVAMRCDAPNVNAAIISEKAMSGILSDDVELRAQLRLNRDSATSEDHLLKESYKWTPELLVYLDEWKWLTDQAVAFTEQVEMYDAATVKKPRLRLNEEDSASVQKSNDRIASHLESEDPITKELLESLQSAKRNVAEVLSPYDGQHSTEWRDAILSTGLATVELLRMIAQDEAAHEVLVGCENGGD